jgi:hypothetical protein
MNLKNPAVILSAALGATLMSAHTHAFVVEKKKITCDAQKSKQYLGKEKIIQMLQTLSQSQPPTNLQVGADCYKVALDKGVSDFVCSRCNQKTSYPTPVLKELGVIQRVVQSLSSVLDVELDDRMYCSHCNKDKSITSLYLIIRYHDTCEEIKTTIDGWSAEVIQAFLTGKDRVVGDTDNESALKSYLIMLGETLIGKSASQ